MEHEPLQTAWGGRVRVVLAAKCDLPALLAVQRRAFTRVALSFGIDPAVMPPASEDLTTLEGLFAEGMVFLVAVDESGTIIGTVRAAVDPQRQGTVEVGRLAVDDGLEGRGIGAALMLGVEAAFPTATCFELFTGAAATGPVHLYQKLGYRIVRSELYKGRFELVWMEKAATRRETGA